MKADSIEELEHQIEDTRQELDQTLHAMGQQLSPRHQVKQAWRFTKRRTGKSLRAGACWSIDHPGRALLAAAAVTGALCFAIIKLSAGRR